MLPIIERRKKLLYKAFIISTICFHTVKQMFYFSFEMRLCEIMKYMQQAYVSLEGRLKAEGFKLRVIKVLKAWEDAAIYPRDFIHKLHNIFLGVEDVCIKIMKTKLL